MNKQKLFMALLLGLTTYNASASPVNRAEAERIAKSFMQKGRNAVVPFRLLKTNAAKAKNVAGTDVQPYYVFNSTASNGGFVIVSGEDRFATVLGYSDKGTFSIDDAPDNVRQWMQQYARYVEAYWANPNLVAKSQSVEAESNVVVAPLLDKIEWGQDYPFNLQCPTYTDAGKTVHYYTGCVATAATQIMRFWKYPKHGTGEKTYTAKGMTLSADFGSTTYDWANMLEAYPKGDTSFTPAQTKAVATLAAQFGVAVEMEYEKAGSGAVPMLVPAALKNYFGYDKRTTMLKRSYYSTSEWMDIMRNELDAGRPVYYGGASDAGSGGHAFVADGYDSNGYVHINWGWYGKSNGFFLINRLNPDDLGEGGGSGGYNLDQEMVIGIQPPTTSTDDTLWPLYGPTRLSIIPTGNTFTLMTYLENLVPEAFNGTLAAVVTKDAKVLSVLKEESVSVAAYKNGNSGTTSVTMRDIPVKVDGLADGDYEVRFAYKAKDANTWQVLRHYSGLPRYADMTVSGGKGTIIGIHAIKPNVTLLEQLKSDGTLHAGGKALITAHVRNNSTDIRLKNVVIRFQSIDNPSMYGESSASVSVYDESEALLQLLVDVDEKLKPGRYEVTAYEKGFADYPFDDSAVGRACMEIVSASDKPVLRATTPVVWQNKEGEKKALQGDDVLMAVNVRNYGVAGTAGIVAHMRDVNNVDRDFVFLQTNVTLDKGKDANVQFYRRMVVDPGTYEVWFSGVDADGKELVIDNYTSPTYITVEENPELSLSVTDTQMPSWLIIGEKTPGSVTLHAQKNFTGTIYVRVRQLTNKSGEIVTMASKSLKAGEDVKLAFNYKPSVAEGTYMLIVETKESGVEKAVGGCDNYYRLINIGTKTGIDNIASDATLNGRILSYSIYNVDGSLVANGGADASVDTQNLQPGVYVLKVRTDKGCVTKKIMKR